MLNNFLTHVVEQLRTVGKITLPYLHQDTWIFYFTYKSRTSDNKAVGGKPPRVMLTSRRQKRERYDSNFMKSYSGLLEINKYLILILVITMQRMCYYNQKIIYLLNHSERSEA